MTGEFRYAFEKSDQTLKIGDKWVHIDKEAVCVSCKNEVLADSFNEVYLSLDKLELYGTNCER